MNEPKIKTHNRRMKRWMHWIRWKNHSEVRWYYRGIQTSYGNHRRGLHRIRWK